MSEVRPAAASEGGPNGCGRGSRCGCRAARDEPAVRDGDRRLVWLGWGMVVAAVFRTTATLALGLQVEAVPLAFALLFLGSGVALIVRGGRRGEPT